MDILLHHQKELIRFVKECREGYLDISGVEKNGLNPRKHEEFLSHVIGEDFEKIKDSEPEKYLASVYLLIQLIFIPSHLKTTQAEVINMLKYLDGDSFRQKILRMYDSAYPADEAKDKADLIIDGLKSGLINKFQKSEKKVSLVDVKSKVASKCIGTMMADGELDMIQLGDNCAFGMSGGKIKAELAGSRLGAYMTGGEIHIQDRVFSDTGLNMSGGRIYTSHAGEGFGWGSNGGVFFADMIGEELGQMSSGSIFVVDANAFGKAYPWYKTGGAVIMDKASIGIHPHKNYTLLIDELVQGSYDQIHKQYGVVEKDIYGYNEDNSEYYIHYEEPLVLPTRTDEALEKWKKGKLGVCVIDKLEDISGDPTDGLQDGILVLRTLPQQDYICEKMEGGVVILEVPGLTLEDAKKIVKMDRSITGVVLIRVEKTEKSNRHRNTTLVEVNPEE